jgi:alkylation response protein AidB-like acyl-CoA dehydrogenase
MTIVPNADLIARDAEALADLAAVAERFAKPDVGRVRALRESGRSFDREVWRRLAELGWLGLSVPESQGGADGDEAAVAVVAEKLGAGAYPEPYVAASVLIARLLSCLAVGGGGGAAELLRQVISGEVLVSLAAPMSAGGPELGGAGAVRAETTDTGLRLTGALDWVQVAGADAFVVQVHTDTDTALVWVPSTADGLTVRQRVLADRTIAATLRFDAVTVSTDALLGAGETAENALSEAIDAAMIGTAAELTGIAGRALSIALDYITTRHQFGRPIGSFQVLQHRAVDMYIQLRVARAALRAALTSRSRPETPLALRRAAAAGAYARACLASGLICRHSVQLHGAIGFTDEYDLGFYVNRMLVLTAWLGGADRQRRRHAELVGAMPVRAPEKGDPR